VGLERELQGPVGREERPEVGNVTLCSLRKWDGGLW
jgi:hypothetical protein